jgi:hypothetical protein
MHCVAYARHGHQQIIALKSSIKYEREYKIERQEMAVQSLDIIAKYTKI